MTAEATWYAVKGPNGDLTWRVESPAKAVGARVNYINDGDAGWQRVFWPNQGSEFPWRIRGRFENGEAADIRSKTAWENATRSHQQLHNPRIVYGNHEGKAAVFTRPLAWLATHMFEMRTQGIRVAAEVDDFYLADPRANVFTKRALQKINWDEYSEDHAVSICVGDSLILSTEHLRDQYWKVLRATFDKKDLPEFHVCRNHVDERFVPDERIPRRTDGMLRIGYMGSDSHYHDVNLIYPALKEAYDAGHEIVFVGINPLYSMNKPTMTEARQRQHWERIEFTHVPWSNTFRGVPLPIDIGFAPLVVNQSTLGKSDIKWLEYALSGAPCVAHNCLVYNRTAVHGETVLLASSPFEYVEAMRALINSPTLRERLVENTLQYIREERMIENNEAEWREAVYG